MARLLSLLVLVAVATASLAAPTGDQMSQLAEKLAELERTQRASDAELHNLGTEIRGLQSVDVRDPAAFTVYRNGDTGVGGGEKVPYNVVITDVNGPGGPNYDIANRQFVTQVPGIYVFHMTTGSYGISGTCRMELYKNNERLVTSYSPSGACGSNSATLELSPGDTVSTRPESSCNVYGSSRRYTTFSGFQIA